MARDIAIQFMPPGMLEFGVTDVDEDTPSTGYGPVGLRDLQVDRDARTGEYLAFVAYNFHQTFFDILQALNEKDIPFRYNIPEAKLRDLPLRDVLTWIYVRYILEKRAIVG
jgi:hypothetical protein